MTRHGRQRVWVCMLAVVAAFGSARLVNAVGYYNMPGDFCQWAGHGYSGGYHAPFVLGPVRTDRAVFPNVTRLSRAPNPYACSPYCGGGYSNYGSGMAVPTMLPMEPSVAPAQ